jgi:membrane protein
MGMLLERLHFVEGVKGMGKKIFRFLEQLYCRYQDDEIGALGAQMTYYLILAFFPFLIFLMTIVSYTSVTSTNILEYISPVVAHDTYTVIETFVNEILKTGNSTLLSIGMIGTLWASSSGLMAIIKGLNKAYDEEEDRPFWKVRGISLLFTLAMGIVILLAFVLLIFGQGIGEHLFKLLHFPTNFAAIWNLIKFSIPLITMYVVFIFLYQITPNRRLTIREVIPGSLFATLGWIVTSVLFAFYVNHWGNYTKTYGSIGGIIILLIWLYLSSIIILMGGELNATLSFLRDGKKKPTCKKFSLSLPFFKK